MCTQTTSRANYINPFDFRRKNKRNEFQFPTASHLDCWNIRHETNHFEDAIESQSSDTFTSSWLAEWASIRFFKRLEYAIPKRAWPVGKVNFSRSIFFGGHFQPNPKRIFCRWANDSGRSGHVRKKHRPCLFLFFFSVRKDGADNSVAFEASELDSFDPKSIVCELNQSWRTRRLVADENSKYDGIRFFSSPYWGAIKLGRDWIESAKDAFPMSLCQ